VGARLGVSRRHPREAGEGRTVKVTSILKVKGHQVATVKPDATIGSIVRTLTAKSIGAVVVSEDGVNLHASDIMVRRPVICLPDDSVTRLMADMTRHRVRHLPVVEDGRLQGIVSIGDVVKHRLDELEMEANILRESFIARH
jgi:CBS domain-containing protein